MRWFVLGSVLLGAMGCSDPTGTIVLVNGSWGGEHLGLVATTGRSDFEFDCATGWIAGPMALDGAGRFDISGVYVPGHGGPARDGEILPQHPARYTGIVRGEVMSLSVSVPELALTLGPFALRYGAPAGVFKCL